MKRIGQGFSLTLAVIAVMVAAANITVEPNTIVAHMAEIRRKIRAIDESFKGIKTERGVGYRWIG